MAVNFRRLLIPDSMCFELETRLVPEGDLSEDFDPRGPKNLERVRESVIAELSELLEASGQVSNQSRLFKDLYNREKRTPTAVGEGIAIPHVRTMQARKFVMAFARSHDGLPFFSTDGEDVHLFFAMVSPPHEDKTYLRIYKALASALLQEEHRQAFLDAYSPNEIRETLEMFR